MDKKNWYKSKTIWSAVISAVIAAYNILAPVFAMPPIPEYIFIILGAFGVYSRTSATTKIG